MDADEKLTALKKAYADIIFNMSKESAARIMASDRKAARLEHELKVAKEEGVRMLVRLKQMMDSKVREAEATALNQRNKIDELEAQLHEAEDIVRDLREELSETQAELETVKHDISKTANKPENVCPGEIPVENTVYSFQSSAVCRPKSQDISPVAPEVTIPYLIETNECQKCCSKVVCACSSYIGTRHLPSIILRRKGRGLYRNGCTQRIRACERDLLEKEKSFAEKVEAMKDNNKSNSYPDEGEDTNKAPAKSWSELEKKLLEGIKIDGFESFPQKRKRTIGQKTALRLLEGKQPASFLESDQFPPVSVNESTDFSESHTKIAPGLSEHKDEQQILLESEEMSEKEINLLDSCVENVQKNSELKKDVAPATDGTGFAVGGTDGKMDAEKFDVPSDNSQANLTERLCIGERVIKYTFQRKRKRQDFSKSEVNLSLEMEKKSRDMPNGHQKLETVKNTGDNLSGYQTMEAGQKMEDKSNGCQKLDPPLSSLIKESRDSRRMAQVARQLLALSEDKRWL